MYIIIVGCGRIGSMLATDLSNEGNDVVIIDQDRLKLDDLGSGFNGLRTVGVEYDNDVLLEAGIDKADVFYAMTPNDNVNLVASQIAKKVFGVKRVISRVNDPNKQFLYDQLELESICPSSLTVIMGKAMIEPHKKYDKVAL